MSVSLGAAEIPLLPALTLLEPLVHLPCFVGLELILLSSHLDAC